RASGAPARGALRPSPIPRRSPREDPAATSRVKPSRTDICARPSWNGHKRLRPWRFRLISELHSHVIMEDAPPSIILDSEISPEVARKMEKIFGQGSAATFF